MYESNEIIGEKQFQVAKNLFDNAQVFLSEKSSIHYRHTYVDMQVKFFIRIDFQKRSFFLDCESE